MKLLPLSIFILIAFAAASVDLSGQAGKIALEGIQNESNQSTLWNWGSAPAGHIVNDSQLIAGAWILPIDRSSMETPSGAVLQGGQPTGEAPFIPKVIELYDMNNPNTASGVFDFTSFKAPSQSQFPRIY